LSAKNHVGGHALAGSDRNWSDNGRSDSGERNVSGSVVAKPDLVALETGTLFDQPRAEAAIRELLIAVGENPDRPGLIDTPARVARAYREMFAGLYVEPDSVLNTTFDEGHQELVLVRDIPMYSTCEHHLVSFHGVAHVGYIPGTHGRVTGLSKLARLVDLYARRPQVMRKLDPRGAIVVVEAEHLCMAMRGIRKPGASTTTSAVRGLLQTSAASRAEALDLILRK
jgi:GTP cyclohydrolase I